MKCTCGADDWEAIHQPYNFGKGGHEFRERPCPIGYCIASELDKCTHKAPSAHPPSPAPAGYVEEWKFESVRALLFQAIAVIKDQVAPLDRKKSRMLSSVLKDAETWRYQK